MALAVDPSKRTPPRRRDWIIATLLAVVSIVQVFSVDTGWPVGRIAITLLTCAAFPYRRQRSVLVALVAFGAEFALTGAAWIADVDLDTTIGQGLAQVLILYAVCRWPAPRIAALGLGATTVLGFGGSFASGESALDNASSLVPWAVVVGFAMAMRYRARLVEVELQGVRLNERNTLARELHDSVAHHVSAISVQAQAARFVATTDPEGAVDAIAAIEETANLAIDEMRRMVGILRSEDDQARTVAATSLATLSRPEGRPRVGLMGEADLTSLPAPVAAAVFRIAQEAVTNASRHSEGVTFVDIDVAIDDDEVRLDVVNDGSPTTKNSGSGFGLVGMRERVEALNGTLDTGARDPSGWQVSAVLPRRRQA